MKARLAKNDKLMRNEYFVWVFSGVGFFVLSAKVVDSLDVM